MLTLVVGGSWLATAHAEEFSGIRRAENATKPWPEDEAVQPAIHKISQTTTPAVKPGRKLVWQSAEPAKTTEITAKAETKAEPKTESKTDAAPKTVARTVDTEVKPVQFIMPARRPGVSTPEAAAAPTLTAPSVAPAAAKPEPTTVATAEPTIVATVEPTKAAAKEAVPEVTFKIIPAAATARRTAEPLPEPIGAGRAEPNMLHPTPALSSPAMQDERPFTGVTPSPAQYESCEESQAKCREGWEKLKAKTIDDIDLDIRPRGLGGANVAVQGKDFPCECIIPRGRFQPREWSCSTFEWVASALCYKPLYFEESSLERYGHTCHPLLQPFVSGAHFFGTFPILPYKMGVQTPCECVYPLGTYRPGDCAPRICDGVPLSIRGTLLEAGAVTGVAFLIP